MSSPNAEAASRRAEAIASASAEGSRTTRIPRPPPPADAFTSSGKPMACAAGTPSPTSRGTSAAISTGTPASRGDAPGPQLGAHGRDRFRRGAHEHQPALPAQRGEAVVLGEEPVAGVHGLGPRPQRRLHDRFHAQVGLGRRRRLRSPRLRPPRARTAPPGRARRRRPRCRSPSPGTRGTPAARSPPGSPPAACVMRFMATSKDSPRRHGDTEE